MIIFDRASGCFSSQSRTHIWKKRKTFSSLSPGSPSPPSSRLSPPSYDSATPPCDLATPSSALATSPVSQYERLARFSLPEDASQVRDLRERRRQRRLQRLPHVHGGQRRRGELLPGHRRLAGIYIWTECGKRKITDKEARGGWRVSVPDPNAFGTSPRHFGIEKSRAIWVSRYRRLFCRGHFIRFYPRGRGLCVCSLSPRVYGVNGSQHVFHKSISVTVGMCHDDTLCSWLDRSRSH